MSQRGLTMARSVLSGSSRKSAEEEELMETIDSKEVLTFEEMVTKTLPNWTAVWRMMADSSSRDGESVKEHSKAAEDDGSSLQAKIQAKARELLTEEEALVNLYKKAVDEARVKQVEFKDKTALMLKQIEKDRLFLHKLTDLFDQ